MYIFINNHSKTIIEVENKTASTLIEDKREP